MPAYLSGLDVPLLTRRQDGLTLVHLFQQLLISPKSQGKEVEVKREGEKGNETGYTEDNSGSKKRRERWSWKEGREGEGKTEG